MPETPSRLQHLVPLIAAQAAGLLCGIVGVRWSSAVLPPEILGTYALLTSTHTIAAFVTHQGVVQHVQRHWTCDLAGRGYALLLARALGAPTAWLGLALAGVLLLLNVDAGAAVGWKWLGWMLAINLLTLGAHAAHAALQAEQRYWAHCAVSAVASATRSFLPLLLVFLGSASLATLGAGFLLHTAIWVAAGAAFLAPAWDRATSAAAETAAAIESPRRLIRAFFGVGICGWIAGNSPRWVAALALSPEATGYFMLALNLASLVPAAISVVGMSYTFPPLFAAARAGASPGKLRRIADRHALLAVAGGQLALLVLAWCGPWLVGVVVDARYEPSMRWLLAAGGGALTTVSAAFYSNLLVAQKRETDSFRLLLTSAGARLLVLLALAAARDEGVFQVGLAVLAWPTLALEWWLVRRWTSAAAR